MSKGNPYTYLRQWSISLTCCFYMGLSARTLPMARWLGSMPGSLGAPLACQGLDGGVGWLGSAQARWWGGYRLLPIAWGKDVLITKQYQVVTTITSLRGSNLIGYRLQLLLPWQAMAPKG